MLNKNGWRKTLSKPFAFLIAVVLIFNLVGCGRSEPSKPNISSGVTPTTRKPVAEVSPPKLIQTLHPSLESYQPQVTIVSPQPSEVLQDNTINVQLEVRDLPLFKNPDWGLGPHLQLILDNQPPQTIYEIDQPIVLSDLTAGTHTLRVFAVYPWGESFKNDGAYSQTSFDVFTATPNNNPNPELPLLTYNSPQGNYGAEPILLDFYLANAPLHLVAAEDPEDEIIDWRIRVTINGESFMIDQWEPIYIDGVKPGKNWVKLEYLDQNGEPLNNVYNNTAGVFTYDPNRQDTLSQLVRGEIAIAQARTIVDPNYTPGAIVPASEPEGVLEEIVPTEPEEIPVEIVPTEPEVILEEIAPTEPEETPAEIAPTEPEAVLEEIAPTPEVEETPAEEVIQTEPIATPAVLEELPEKEDIEAIPEPSVEPEAVEVIEPVEPETQTEATKTGGIFNNISNRVKQLPFLNKRNSQPTEASVQPEVVEPLEPAAAGEPEPQPTEISGDAETGGIFNNISNRVKQLPFLNKGTSQPTEISDEAESEGIFNNISNRVKQLPFLNKGNSQPTEISDEPEVVKPVEPVIEPVEPAAVEKPQPSPELIRDELEFTSDIPTEQPIPEELETTPPSEVVVEDVSQPTADETVEPEPIVQETQIQPQPEVEDVSEPTVDETVEPEASLQEPPTQPQPEPVKVPETVEESTATEVQVPEAKKTPKAEQTMLEKSVM